MGYSKPGGCPVILLEYSKMVLNEDDDVLRKIAPRGKPSVQTQYCRLASNVCCLWYPGGMASNSPPDL